MFVNEIANVFIMIIAYGLRLIYSKYRRSYVIALLFLPETWKEELTTHTIHAFIFCACEKKRMMIMFIPLSSNRRI
jgi:hypothetical protein